MHCSIGNDIDWVGYVDWHVRDFHSYNTDQGATYNAYLVRDAETALIDTVKAPYAELLLRNIAELTPFENIKWVVCNHAEPDHAGALQKVMAALPQATLLCTKKCQQILSQYFDASGWKIKTVSTGDRISIGARELVFAATPFAHWPESMFTYIPQDKTLFSMDAFGQHCATSARFEEEAGLEMILEQAKTYYANILMPYGPAVAKAMAAVADFAIETVAPAHGVIWRRHIPEILDAYRNWSSGKVNPKALVLFDSMWESTTAMAQAIYEGASQPGVEVKLIHIRRSNLTRIADEMLDAAAVAVGSATLNAGMMPAAGAVMTYLDGLKPLGKAGFAFGSYGWSRGGPEIIHEQLSSWKWDLLRAPLKAQYRPTPEILEECRAAGAALAGKAREKAQG